jgi:hypothetical protein
MNRLLTTLVLAVVLAEAMYMAPFPLVERSWAADPSATVATGVPEPPPDTGVFDMKYRGLSLPDDPLSYRHFWSFSRSDDPNGQKDPFVLAVQSQLKERTPVYNARLTRAQWSVVELKDKKPVAFYFDLNADGKLSDDEKFLPTAPGPGVDSPCAFITSDFLIRTQDGREIPFRVMLVAMKNGSDALTYVWSPCCVLEGQAALAGQPVKLVLYADRFSGSFTTFGSCSYALFSAEQKLEGYPAHYPLTSLIPYKGTFYRLHLSGVHATGKTVRVTLEKDTRPTGRWTVNLEGKEAVKIHVEQATINGASDNSIHFAMPDTLSPLPEGRYRLSSVAVSYGVQNDNDWRATIEGPEFEIDAGRTRQVELGGLALSVRAIDENDRNRSDAKERSVFARGTSIYLAPRIKGKAGEVYTRFSQKNEQNDVVDVNAHVTILDLNGKAMASADMPYT